MFKVNNKDTRTISMMSFCCFEDFTAVFSISNVDFEHVLIFWENFTKNVGETYTFST